MIGLGVFLGMRIFLCWIERVREDFEGFSFGGGIYVRRELVRLGR